MKHVLHCFGKGGWIDDEFEIIDRTTVRCFVTFDETPFDMHDLLDGLFAQFRIELLHFFGSSARFFQLFLREFLLANRFGPLLLFLLVFVGEQFRGQSTIPEQKVSREGRTTLEVHGILPRTDIMLGAGTL